MSAIMGTTMNFEDFLKMDLEELKEIRGVREGGDPANEAENFYSCATCGQSVDKRELWKVVYHERDGDHQPLPSDA